MPSTGIISCGTCPFNAANQGPGAGDSAPRGRCRIRGLPLDDPLATYCANHPELNPARVDVPVGPVYSLADEILVPAADTPRLRNRLLKLLAAIPTPPSDEHPFGSPLDAAVIAHLGSLHEKRAIGPLSRLSPMLLDANPLDPMPTQPRSTDKAAREALSNIAIEHTFDYRGNTFPDPIPCPCCEGGRLLHVVWGMPVGCSITPDPPDVVFGGCCIGLWTRSCDTCSLVLSIDPDEVRNAYRPERVRVLLINEAPPDPNHESKFFYNEKLAPDDSLFRGIADSVLEKAWRARGKAAALVELKNEGFWMVDALDEVAELVHAIQPDGVIFCVGTAYEGIAESLRQSGINLLHAEPLPSPVAASRKEFVSDFRSAVARLGSPPPSTPKGG